ncbi:MAG: hypothetical protein ACRDJ5_07955, partial [Actinomycetota bacterium]
MSTVAESVKRWRVPLMAGALVAVLLVAGIAAFLVTDRVPQAGRGGRGGGRAPRLAAPDIDQAPWRIRTFAAGAVWQLTKKDRARLRAQGRRISGLVRDVYNTMFLHPLRASKVLKGSFLQPAALSLMRSEAGLPKRAKDVRF